MITDYLEKSDLNLIDKYKRKKDKTVQGFFHFLKNKDKKAVDKLDNIIKKLGTKKGIAYIDSYRQNYLRMSNSEGEK